MSEPQALAWIVGALADTYTGRGIAIWLHCPHRHLDNRRPIDMLAAGDWEPVVREVERLDGAVWPGEEPR